MKDNILVALGAALALLILAMLPACSKEAPVDSGEPTEFALPDVDWMPTTFGLSCDGPCPRVLDLAVKSWEVFAGEALFEVGGERPLVIRLISQEEMDERTPKGKFYNGQAQFIHRFGDGTSGCLILLVDNVQDSPEIIEHELGHCLGFDHSTNPESIMFHSAGKKFTPGMLDVLDLLESGPTN